MVSRAARKSPVIIDPSFYVPPETIGVDFIYDGADEYSDELIQPDDTIDDIDSYIGYDEDESDYTPDEPELDSPDFTVVSQTVRIAPDGTSVVDVLISVDDVPGAIDYDVRVTKI